jgi:hypothetical protein
MRRPQAGAVPRPARTRHRLAVAMCCIPPPQTGLRRMAARIALEILQAAAVFYTGSKSSAGTSSTLNAGWPG